MTTRLITLDLQQNDNIGFWLKFQNTQKTEQKSHLSKKCYYKLCFTIPHLCTLGN